MHKIILLGEKILQILLSPYLISIVPVISIDDSSFFFWYLKDLSLISKFEREMLNIWG